MSGNDIKLKFEHRSMALTVALCRSAAGNPKGIPSQSPGLRGTSYPGSCVGQRADQPQRGCGPGAGGAATPLGLLSLRTALPRVARSSQPWAVGRNPVGIPGDRHLKRIEQERPTRIAGVDGGSLARLFGLSELARYCFSPRPLSCMLGAREYGQTRLTFLILTIGYSVAWFAAYRYMRAERPVPMKYHSTPMNSGWRRMWPARVF